MKLEIFNVKLNPLKDEDVRAIVCIECHPMVRRWLVDYADEKFEKELEEYRRFFDELQNNDRVEVLVAKLNGRIVGFLALWRMDEGVENTTSIGISVHPDYWNRGIATNLIREAIKLAKEKGVKKLIIETLDENSAMKHVAEKLGFKLETVRKGKIFKDGIHHDEDVYSLQL
ncbi:GNAT family N-acetyltransferase [Candidatus Bathyarchaeota archaeon]|nr:GNAT family N-acetyltransferase [Candidatus Bathyarchaeota archaeon]MBS7613322.1 GNAT family N-acetyltransferase [Candidatus Bathyarchaeota archaeon]MBS7617025.1 GNAT family N-acetyltransferase [Candidatus Bathyarchaeota archaeon]